MSEPQNPWRNRIVDYGEENPAVLVKHPKNWRAHPDNQKRALETVFTRVGIVDPVMIQQGTGTIVDGHLRVGMAAAQGMETIPVQYVDLTDEEVDYTLATLDPIGALATTDLYHLTSLVGELELGDEALETMLGDIVLNAGGHDDRDFTPSYEPQSERSQFTASDIDYASDRIERRINQDVEQTELECPKCHKHFYIH